MSAELAPAVITRFYEAFARRDAEAMAACYADDVHFSDPAFPNLHGEDARDMWRMLVGQGKDLVVTFKDVTGDAAQGTAHWDAEYTFSVTKRHVINRIDARFELRDGRIVRHVDTFDFPLWARQALGLPGLLFGRTGFLQRAVQKKAGKQLQAYSARRRG